MWNCDTDPGDSCAQRLYSQALYGPCKSAECMARWTLPMVSLEVKGGFSFSSLFLVFLFVASGLSGPVAAAQPDDPENTTETLESTCLYGDPLLCNIETLLAGLPTAQRNSEAVQCDLDTISAYGSVPDCLPHISIDNPRIPQAAASILDACGVAMTNAEAGMERASCIPANAEILATVLAAAGDGTDLVDQCLGSGTTQEAYSLQCDSSLGAAKDVVPIITSVLDTLGDQLNDCGINYADSSYSPRANVDCNSLVPLALQTVTTAVALATTYISLE